MRALAALAVLAGLTAPSLAAADLAKVTAVDRALLGRLFNVDAPEAQKVISGQTARIELGEIEAELAERLPYGPNAVVFFDPSGDLLVWSSKSGQVEAGYWEVLDNGAFNDVCLRFGKFGLDSVCASPEIANNEWLKELAPGNAFALAADQPVPVALAAEPSTLTDIAATLP
jgi:hypothetical protein